MIFRRLKDKITGYVDTHSESEPSTESDHTYIFILEDDPDQLNLLSSLALRELQTLIDDETISEENKEKITNIKIISVSHINDLKKASTKYNEVLLAILDGNTPNEKGGEPHDQFIKKNHKITGKHLAVEIVKKSLPNTPITMVSTLSRFRNTVVKYYKSKYNLDINFINKSEQDEICQNFSSHFKQYLEKE